MRPLLRHLLPGLALILAASAALLLSDLNSRGPRRTAHVAHSGPYRFAVLQHSSSPVMDDTLAGILAGLASRGYVDGGRLQVKIFNPEGDMPTATQMAGLIAGGGYDLAAAISTVRLQALASADRAGRVPFVFCAVSDPLAANIGIRSLDTLDKPAHLTGYGTSQPVEAIFREAVAINPRLKTVGVVWNPAEANSLACTKRARAICKELGLTLIEAPIEGSKDVREAADSLVSRGAEAFWTGGDATLLTAYDVLQQVADKARIPIFSNISGHAKRGALFDYGASYYQVGYQTGLVAADILDGRSPASIPVRDLMPAKAGLNEKTRDSLHDVWTFTPDQYAQAAFVVEADGHVREIASANATTAVASNTTVPAGASSAAAPPLAFATGPAVPPPAGKLPWRIQVIQYVETPPSEQALEGLLEGLHHSGLIDGRDYVLRVRSAQNDMPTIGTIFDAATSEGTDLFVAFSTPTLQTAVRKVKDTPVVFTFVADPLIAGAGTSFEQHLPNFTGISTLAPAAEMIDLLQAYFPQWKRIGTLYCPAEINSIQNLKFLQKACDRAGIVLDTVPANSISELPDAARALAAKNIDAIVQLADNLSSAGYTAIAQAARAHHLPMFAFQSPAVEQGAALALSMDYHQSGLDAAAMVARILRGENPASIPFSLTSKKVLALNLRNAADQGVALPPALLDKATKIVP